jgi:putative salt-induced outer membrane protein YdiY
MKPHIVIFCFSVLFALPLFARESTDVIVMKNGDHFTCEIKGLSGGVLYVGLPYVVQTLSVDWSKVAHLESKQLFLIKTEDGSVYRGVLKSMETPGGHPLQIQVAEAPQQKVVLDSSRIVEVAVTSEKVLQRFTGGLGFGTIYSKGNQSVQYNVSGLAAYPRERWAVQAGLSSSLSTSSGTTTSTHNQLTLGGIHLLPWNEYFYGVFDGFLQSTEQGIAHQNTLGGGIGRYIKNTNRTTISILGGFAWQNTNYNPTIVPIAAQNVATAMINADLKLFRFNRTNLDLNAILLPALSQPGRVYFSTNASYNVKIIGNLSWNISFYGNWDSRPPGNLPGSDYGTTSGLNWTFGSSLRTTPTAIQ